MPNKLHIYGHVWLRLNKAKYGEDKNGVLEISIKDLAKQLSYIELVDLLKLKGATNIKFD